MARAAFLGSKRVGLRVLRSMVDVVGPPHEVCGAVTLDDAADSRSELEAIMGIAGTAPFEVRAVSRLAEMNECLFSWRPDIVIVAGWYQLLQLETFPTTSFYGFHFSPLPRYRGNAPLVWQILRGETEVGVTLFRLTDGLDDGDVVSQRLVALSREETIADALSALERASEGMVAEQLPRLLAGEARHQPQDHAGATYCSLRIPEDGLIDWTLPAEQVHDFVRAQTRPYPGAFTMLPGGGRAYIWRSRPEDRGFVGVPGSVAAREDHDVIVACGMGALRILEAEVKDAQPLAPRDIFRSLRMRL